MGENRIGMRRSQGLRAAYWFRPLCLCAIEFVAKLGKVMFVGDDLGLGGALVYFDQMQSIKYPPHRFL